MIKNKSVCKSFLLRLWHADNAGDPVWRFSLEAPGSGEQLRFLNLADLVEFIQTQISTHEQKRVSTAEKETGGERVP
jgi:hypothetical protein